MAERRMMAIRIIDDDAFLDLPAGARLLYYDLSMRADDDGFITPKKVMRMIGAGQKDLDALVQSGFLIAFDSGVVAITHWRQSNTLRKDRYTPTAYQEEFKELEINNGVYRKCCGCQTVAEESSGEEEPGNQTATNGCQSGNQAATRRQPAVATGKDRLGEERNDTRIDKSMLVSQRKSPSPRIPGSQTAFRAPTLDQVRAYFGGNMLRGDPDLFYSTYASVGWVDGLKRPVQDWHALAMKWSSNEGKKAAEGGGKPRDWSGSYDADRIEEVTI